MAAGGLPLLWAVRPHEFGPGFFRTMALVYFFVGLGGAYGAEMPASLGSVAGVSWVLMVAFLALAAIAALLLWRNAPNPHPPIFFAACYAGLGHLIAEALHTPVN